MDIKHITCDIRTWKKAFISRHILRQHWYTCPIALPVRRKSQWSFGRCLSHFRTWSGIICDIRTSLVECIDLVENRFTRQTLLTVNRKHFCMNMLCIEFFCPQNGTTECCSSVVHPQARSLFWLLTPASEHAHARLLPRLSWRLHRAAT
jgi:hypothetical protein